jgi:hypothetical protein
MSMAMVGSLQDSRINDSIMANMGMGTWATAVETQSISAYAALSTHGAA